MNLSCYQPLRSRYRACLTELIHLIPPLSLSEPFFTQFPALNQRNESRINLVPPDQLPCHGILALRSGACYNPP